MSSQIAEMTGDAVPLIVDVDDALIRGDLLVEGLARLLAAAPLNLCLLPFWLGAGRAALKRRVASAVTLPPDTLVFNPAVLETIDSARNEGRPVYLASASDELCVAPLADRVGADGYFASDGKENLAGAAKAQKLVARFGAQGFDYVGNEWRDLAVWRQARRAIAVDAAPRLAAEVRKIDPDALFLPRTGGRLQDYLKALRPLHWVKNILVFAPLIAAQIPLSDFASYGLALIAFVALSACASGTYLLNDILDLPHDRQHETKRRRPLASGRIPLIRALALGFVLIIGALAVAAAAAWDLAALVGLYLLVTWSYSLYLKRKIFIDVVALASLYTIRVLAGAAAVTVAVTPWFLGFSIFLFLALAIVKRQRELHGLGQVGQERTSGRAYFVEDLPVLAALAGSSSFAAIVVLALFISSPEVADTYARPELLWLLCPFLTYWLGRMVLLANRGAIHDDPIVFAVRDKASWLVGAVAAALFAAAL